MKAKFFSPPLAYWTVWANSPAWHKAPWVTARVSSQERPFLPLSLRVFFPIITFSISFLLDPQLEFYVLLAFFSIHFCLLLPPFSFLALIFCSQLSASGGGAHTCASVLGLRKCIALTFNICYVSTECEVIRQTWRNGGRDWSSHISQVLSSWSVQCFKCEVWPKSVSTWIRWRNVINSTSLSFLASLNLGESISPRIQLRLFVWL